MVTLLVTVLAASGCGRAKKTPPEQQAAQAYLTALGAADSATAGRYTTDAAAAAAAITKSLAGLGTGVRGDLRVTGLTDRQPTAATADYEASWRLPGLSTPWKYTGSLSVVKQAEDWRVSWDASAIHPRLAEGSHLTLKRNQPARAALQDASGTPLFTPTPVVTVGINPAAVRDLPGLAARLAAVPALQTTAGEITSAVNAAGKEQFVPIITLRRAAYQKVRAQIYNLPGTQFQSDTRLLPPSANFARPLLGSVGQATAEIVEESQGQIRAGDTVGVSGLQRALDAQLRGTPGVEVYAAGDDGTLGAKLGTVTPPAPGKPARLTLERSVQAAADATLASESRPASIVALQPSTGKILAVANSASAPGDIALTGQYPAGSTFKIATYTAALQADPALTAATAVDCPATVTVNGRTFQNEDKFQHGRIPLTAAFGYSCNTTAISFGMKLPAGALAKAAASLGLGADWTLPVPAFSGSIPATATGTEQAAEAIGQGKVLVSPLLMASMAGAAASGTPIAPSLVTGQQAKPGPALGDRVTAQINALMRATVAMPGATGYPLLHDLPGGIRGKTGTAEFGTDDPPRSHSWFAGSRGDLAIAVFVYGGEKSSTGAVPLARQFFTKVP